MLKTMQPMRGGLWLAFDRSTGFHWMLDVADVRLAPGVRYTGPGSASVGVVTVRSRSGDPIFQIEEADTLVWDEPERCLRVREGGSRGAEIVLERVGDFNTPMVSETQLHEGAIHASRVVNVERDRYLTIDDTYLSTGDAEIDANLTVMEASLIARSNDALALSSEVLASMNRELDQFSRNPNVRSYVWLAALRQRVTLASRVLAV